MADQVTSGEVGLKILHVSALLLPVLVFALELLLDRDENGTSDRYAVAVPVAGGLIGFAALAALVGLARTGVTGSVTVSLLLLGVSFLAVLVVPVRVTLDEVIDATSRSRDDERRGLRSRVRVWVSGLRASVGDTGADREPTDSSPTGSRSAGDAEGSSDESTDGDSDE